MAKPITYCNVGDCETRVQGHGLCARHYQLNRRHGSTADRPRGRRPKILGGCKRCGEVAVSRDLCKRHYATWLRTERRGVPCSVEDCDRSRYSNELCSLHYGRLRKYGSTDDRKRPVADRFWEKVNKTKACWLWTAALNVGYGVFGVKAGRNMLAHRWAYEDANGPIADGTHLDHLCRTPACVRPSHLEPVLPRENMRRGFVALGKLPHCPTCFCKVDETP